MELSIIIGNDRWKIITGRHSDWVGSRLGIILWVLEMFHCCIVKCRLQHAFSHIFEIELCCALKELRRRSSHCKQKVVEDWMPIGNIYEYLCVVHISWHVMYVFVVGVCNNDIKINLKKEEKKLNSSWTMTKTWTDLKYLYAIVSRGEVPIWTQNFGWLLNWSLFDRLKLAKHKMCNLKKKRFSILKNRIFHTNGNKIHLIFKSCNGVQRDNLCWDLK